MRLRRTTIRMRGRAGPWRHRQTAPNATRWRLNRSLPDLAGLVGGGSDRLRPRVHVGAPARCLRALKVREGTADGEINVGCRGDRSLDTVFSPLALKIGGTGKEASVKDGRSSARQVSGLQASTPGYRRHPTGRRPLAVAFSSNWWGLVELLQQPVCAYCCRREGKRSPRWVRCSFLCEQPSGGSAEPLAGGTINGPQCSLRGVDENGSWVVVGGSRTAASSVALFIVPCSGVCSARCRSPRNG